MEDTKRSIFTGILNNSRRAAKIGRTKERFNKQASVRDRILYLLSFANGSLTKSQLYNQMRGIDNHAVNQALIELEQEGLIIGQKRSYAEGYKPAIYIGLTEEAINQAIPEISIAPKTYKTVAIKMNELTHKQLKVIAMEEERTISDTINLAIESYLSKNGYKNRTSLVRHIITPEEVLPSRTEQPPIATGPSHSPPVQRTIKTFIGA